MPCEIRLQGQHFAGMVLDVSPSGLFVQTSAKVQPGDRADMEVVIPGCAEPLLLIVEVARRRRVPAQLRSVAAGGIGLRIANAPEAYYRFLQGLADVTAERAPAEPGSQRDPSPGVEAPAPELACVDWNEPEERAYQVRAKQVSGPRSRRLFVEADDEASAAEVALKQLGEGWTILEVSSAAP